MRALTLLVTALSAFLWAGCGNYSGPLSLEPAARTKVSEPPPAPPVVVPTRFRVRAAEATGVVAAAEVRQEVTLRAGWNAVAFTCSQVSSVEPGPALGFIVYENGSYTAAESMSVAGINRGKGTGRGFWIYSSQAGVMSYQGSNPAGTQDVPASSGWNLVAFPSASAALAVTRGGTPIPLTQALLPNFYEIGESGYRIVDVTSAAVVRNDRAYWIYSAGEGVSLRLGQVQAPSLTVVEAALQKSGAGWTATNTLGSSYTPETLANLAGVMPSPFATTAPKVQQKYSIQELPSALSWRDRAGVDYVTAVRHQGQAGSCTAFATTSVWESMRQIQLGTPNSVSPLSPWYVYVRTQFGPGLQFETPPIPLDPADGRGMDHPAQYMKLSGGVDESIVPYPASVNQAPPKAPNPLLPTIPGTTPLRRVNQLNYITNAVQLKNALQTGPVLAGMAVYGDFFYYKSGVYKPAIDPSTGLRFPLAGYHAVMVYGYDQSGWLVKNSWGSDWGEGGFCRIAYNASPDSSQVDNYAVQIIPGDSQPTPSVSPSPQSSTLTLTAPVSTLIVNQSTQLSVVLKSGNVSTNVTSQVSYGVAGNATVTVGGLLTATGPGTCFVNATVNGTLVSNTLNISLSAPPPGGSPSPSPQSTPSPQLFRPNIFMRPGASTSILAVADGPAGNFWLNYAQNVSVQIPAVATVSTQAGTPNVVSLVAQAAGSTQYTVLLPGTQLVGNVTVLQSTSSLILTYPIFVMPAGAQFFSVEGGLYIINNTSGYAPNGSLTVTNTSIANIQADANSFNISAYNPGVTNYVITHNNSTTQGAIVVLPR